jgi:cysteine synthase A
VAVAICKSVLETIGRTPLVELSERTNAGRARVLAKVEFFNPGGSVKDRPALNMILEAERRGDLRPGMTIVEPTSGNTGVGLALVSAVRGYRLVLTMPETMSVERVRLARAYGAEVVLTPGDAGMAGAVAEAERIRAARGGVVLQQFENPDNAPAHEQTTGPEIWSDTGGRVDVFVAGVGTGGTLTGVARYLKSLKRDVEIVAVEPADSPLLSGGAAGPHALQGIGANFVPKTLDRSFVDRVLCVSADDAFEAARLCASREGLLVGISSGAALAAAFSLSSDPAYADKTIVVLLPDTGERYLSTGLFS